MRYNEHEKYKYVLKVSKDGQHLDKMGPEHREVKKLESKSSQKPGQTYPAGRQ